MIAHGNKIKLFCGNACKDLAKSISDKLKMKLSDCEVGKIGRASCRKRVLAGV